MLAVNVTCLVWMILPLLQLKCVCICVCSAAVWYLLPKDLSDYFRLFKLNLIYCLLLHVLVGFLLNVYLIVYFCSLVWNRHYRIYTLTLFFCLLLFVVEKTIFMMGNKFYIAQKQTERIFCVYFFHSFIFSLLLSLNIS